MILLLNPILEGLQAARRAAVDVIGQDDEVTMDDKGDHWVFEFTPRTDELGGGARVCVAKADITVINVVYGQ